MLRLPAPVRKAIKRATGAPTIFGQKAGGIGGASSMGNLTLPLMLLAVAVVAFTVEGWLSATGSNDFATRVPYMLKANLALLPILTALVYMLGH